MVRINRVHAVGTGSNLDHLRLHGERAACRAGKARERRVQGQLPADQAGKVRVLPSQDRETSAVSVVDRASLGDLQPAGNIK